MVMVMMMMMVMVMMTRQVAELIKAALEQRDKPDEVEQVL